MRQRVIDNLTNKIGDSPALSPVRREQFLVYLMGPYRTFDVDELIPDDTDIDTDSLPSFATWNDHSSDYDESDVLRLLTEIRECLRDRGFNAFLAIDVGIDLEEMDAASQSIAFARASNAIIFILPQVGDNLGVGIEIGSVLEDVFTTDTNTESFDRSVRLRRFMVAAEPTVRSAMLRAVHTRWDASLRTFTDADDLCRLSAQFCTHIQNEEVYGDLEQMQ